MIVFKSKEELYKDGVLQIEPCIAALGNFDGIHFGHQKLINTAVAKAKDAGLKSAVFTFTDHPINVMSGHAVTKIILKIEDKIKLLEEMGVDYLFSFDFEKVRTMSPEEFVKDLLVDNLLVKHAVCGFNYSFGYKAGGHKDDLIDFGLKYGFGVTAIDPVEVDSLTVSSTLIRGCLENGEVDRYKEYTGRDYTIYGTVIEGEHNGRKMGFPTVNLSLDSTMALPANGVYVTRTFINDTWLPSITNVGNKPTIGTFDKNAETHIFNFTENAYGKPLIVQFIKMQRKEQKFNSLESLAAQIEQDCLEAKKYHNIY